MLSHLIKIYAICKFSRFRLWYLKELNYSHVRFETEASDILLNNGSLSNIFLFTFHETIGVLRIMSIYRTQKLS